MKRRTGFTLIELLIVIAILGILATIVILTINPTQKLAQTRDAGRQTTISQLGHTLASYSAAHEGRFPAEDSTWITTLVDAEGLVIVPPGVNYSVAGKSSCVLNRQPTDNGWCYDATGGGGDGPVITYARLESDILHSSCPNPLSDAAWFVYSTSQGRAGIVCTPDASTEPVAGSQNFVN